jgi:hypothetical protein
VRGEIEGARGVYEENIDRLAWLENERYSLLRLPRCERAREWLKERVFANRMPCDLNPRVYSGQQCQDLFSRAYVWWAQEGILNHAQVIKDYRYVSINTPAVVAIWDGGTSAIGRHAHWIRGICGSGKAVIVPDLTGVGALLPNTLNSAYGAYDFYGTTFKLADDLIWLNDSLAAMRIYDVLRIMDVLDVLPGVKADSMTFFAHGLHGIYPQLAAVLDKRIKISQVVDGIDSYAGWIKSRHYDDHDIMSIILPGMLRYFDIQDLPDLYAAKTETMNAE